MWQKRFREEIPPSSLLLPTALWGKDSGSLLRAGVGRDLSTDAVALVNATEMCAKEEREEWSWLRAPEASEAVKDSYRIVITHN